MKRVGWSRDFPTSRMKVGYDQCEGGESREPPYHPLPHWTQCRRVPQSRDFLTLTLENNDEPGSWYAFWVVPWDTPYRTLLGYVKIVSKKVVDWARMPFGSMFADFIFRKRILGGGLIVTEALPKFGNGNGNGNDWHVRPETRAAKRAITL